MGQCFTSIEDDIALFWQLIESFWMYALCGGLRVRHCIGGEELTLGQAHIIDILPQSSEYFDPEKKCTKKLYQKIS